MNLRAFAAPVASLAFAAGLLVTSPARADTPWREVSPVDLADVPVVEVARAPKFDRVTAGPYAHEWFLSRAERDRAKPFDGAHAPRARFEEPRHGGNLVVVLNDNLDFERSNGILRFFQQNPEAEPMTASCGLGPKGEQSVRSFALWREEGGHRFSFRHAWFDYVSCKGEMLRSFDTKVTPVAGGLAFVYRTACPTCDAGEREQLHFVMPTMRSIRGAKLTYFSFMTIHGGFTIEPGQSTSVEAKFENEAVLTWNRVLDRPLPTPPFTWLRIEVVRGSDDPVPIARVYTHT